MADSLESKVRRLAAEAGCEVAATDVWLLIRPPGSVSPPHGWKLHVSARPHNVEDVVDRLVPFLLAQRTVFKLCRSRQVLMRINSGNDSPAAVGKAFTIYPPAERVTELGHALAELLVGMSGPRIRSDRRISADAPVYYRYGPFQAHWQLDHRGSLAAQLHGPDGTLFDGLATPFYRQPEWVNDPFQPEAEASSAPEQPVLAGRYRLLAGVQHHVRGSVFRAERLPDLTSVIVKCANAYVGEDEKQYDARLRLRNERRILTMLAGINGVPDFLDHLGTGQDELLVITDQGPTNLVQDVADHGRYPAAGDRRSVRQLAVRLAGIVAAIHARGVLIRDLSPKNVVLDGASASIVDFGIAAADRIAPVGRTPGYASPAQQRGAPPTPADDCYALGMTLLFALTGVDPLTAEDDSGWARVRALELLELYTAAAPDDVFAVIAGLLSPDPAAAVEVLNRLASQPPRWPSAVASPLPRTPTVTTDLAAQITDFLIDQLLGQARKLLADPEIRSGRADASIQRGLSGIGLQLLHHRDHPGCLETVSDLADLISTARVAEMPDGLFVGSAGVCLFLIAANQLGILTPSQRWATAGHLEPVGPDLISGAAGIAIAQLRIFQRCGDPQALQRVRELAWLLLDPASFSEGSDSPVPRSGVDPTAGMAHGRAATVYLLTALSTIDDSFRSAADHHAAALAADVTRLAADARRPGTRPIVASWCQGLAGVARTLHFCAETLHAPDLTGAAIEASEACLDRVPRMAVIGQCCGLAGVGSMLLNLTTTRRAADRPDGLALVAGQLLRRSSGPPDRPVFQARFGADDASWGYGTAGVLSFFRSLRDGALGGTLETDAYSAVFLDAPTQ